MSDEKVTKQKFVESPFEKVLNIEPGNTLAEYEERLPAELVDHQEYDEKDKEIEEQFQDVYEKAMDAFDAQSDIVDTVEGKYAARNAEVASQFLNTALNAAKEKSTLKQHKDKVEIAKQRAGAAKTVNNNLIVDRNDLLKMLQQNEEMDTEIKDITPTDETD